MKGCNTNCPYVKIPNEFKNISGIPTPMDQYGKHVKEICVPNLSYVYPIDGFGVNECINNRPYHISFFTGEKQQCYSENTCTKASDKCKAYP